MGLESRIVEVLQGSPGLRSRDIADQLGADKAEIVSCLSRHRGKLFVQESGSFRWRLRQSNGAATHPRAGEPETPLARICRYYLDCIERDAELNLSVAPADCVPLDALPLTCPFDSEAARDLLLRSRRDRSRTALYIGYPVRLRRLRSNSPSLRLEPICVWPLQERLSDPSAPPAIADPNPLFNFAALRALGATTGDYLDEVLQLSEDLGIAGASEPPDVDDLFERLHAVRPEWDWIEAPDPHQLSSSPSLTEIAQPGIYNRAVLILGERSPYTRGLELELAALADLTPQQYEGTALAAWLSGDPPVTAELNTDPLIEIAPLNFEQRTAVTRGLSASLTVITGPPGTGKSQVVASLLVNAAWRSKRVLFASRNNKAVDVVESRCNDNGARRILLRVGSPDHQIRLADYLDSLLAAASTAEDQVRFDEALANHARLRDQLDDLQARWQSLIALRNRVDALDQKAEPARAAFPDFPRQWDPLRDAARVAQLTAAARALAQHRSALLRPFAVRRFRRAVAAAVDVLTALGLPQPQPGDASDFARALDSRFADACLIADYFAALRDLQQAPRPEDLSSAQVRLLAQLNENSAALWNAWLRLHPDRLTPEQRTQLGRYLALLRMVFSGDRQQTAADRRVYREYHHLMHDVAGAFGCWAVTSLSVRNRIPLEPGFFDLIVIDEASQCDIASALPLLYRAKAAVIIGDPKQLRHISGIAEKHDRQLIAKHGILGERESWSYSTNSLFDLARSLCRSEDIVNLREHHRSHGDIIAFANSQFYDGRLRIATAYDRLQSPDAPAVRWVDVKGVVTRPSIGGAMNEQEAVAVFHELRRLVFAEQFPGTVGVVSPFRAQANRIRELIADDDELHRALAARKFIADTAHGFQGDERDLIIFSPVVSARTTDGAVSFLRRNGNVFNVAVTRARSALIAVGDREACRTSGIDYLARFADYAARLATTETAATPEAGPDYPAVTHPELVSPWERTLYRALCEAGIRPIPQYSLEQYILDFVVISGSRRLNIEVDGEHYHRNWDGELCRRDQLRDQRLMALGWDIMRFWVYEVRDNIDTCVERVQAWFATSQP